MCYCWLLNGVPRRAGISAAWPSLGPAAHVHRDRWAWAEPPSPGLARGLQVRRPGLVAPGADITGDPTLVALIHWQSQCQYM